MSSIVTLSKKELRKSLLNKRDTLKDVSLSIVRAIIDSKILDKYNTIGIYYPLKGEINLLPLVDYYKDKSFCFPKTEDTISFYMENDLTNFSEKKFNVLEPNSNNFIARDDIECFIVPCVGITKNRQRIGYGKGYYDRYLMGYNGLKIAGIYKELNNIDFKCDDYDLVLDYVFEG